MSCRTVERKRKERRLLSCAVEKKGNGEKAKASDAVDGIRPNRVVSLPSFPPATE